MKIAHVCATYPPYQGGTGNVCAHNAQQLAQRGHAVSVFTTAHPAAPAQESLQGVQVRRLSPVVRFGNAALLPALAQAMADYEIVHFHYPFFGGEAAVLGARRGRIPLVITYHQDVLLTGLPGLVEKLLRPTSSRWVLRSAARLLFTSHDYGAASHARRLLQGRQAQIGEMPNGVDADFFTPGPPSPALQRRFCPRGDERVLLLVAALDQAHYFKGVTVLLEALRPLPGEVRAIVVGEGELRPAYQARAGELGLGERVSFAGRVSLDELRDYYRLADLNVLPSTTMGEAFGLVLIEALACGTPVIASNLPGVRSVVAQGVDGWLTLPGDPLALRQALTEALALPQAQLRRMGAAGRRKVEQRYTWKAIGARLEALYQELLG